MESTGVYWLAIFQILVVGWALPTNHESKATSFNAIQHLVDDVALEKFEAIAPENFDSLQRWLSNHGHLNLNIDPSAFTPTQYIH